MVCDYLTKILCGYEGWYRTFTGMIPAFLLGFNNKNLKNPENHCQSPYVKYILLIAT